MKFSNGAVKPKRRKLLTGNMKVLIPLLFFCGRYSALSAEIYAREPFGEAIYGLASSSVLIAHDLTTASPLERVAVFRLRGNRLVAITSRSAKVGEPYSIIGLPLSDSKGMLNKDTKKISSLVFEDITMPDKAPSASLPDE